MAADAEPERLARAQDWEFPQIGGRGVPYFGVLIIRILLFRVVYYISDYRGGYLILVFL